MTKKFSSKILLSTQLIFILGFSVFAQTPPDTTEIRTIYLEEVTVKNERFDIPFSLSNRDIEVVDARIIQSLPVNSVAELLGYVAGVDIRQRGPWGGQTDISINGGTFDQTLILLDGIKIIDPQTGHLMMNLPVSPESIERIEVLKGAAASAYGINAINGAINIITRMPELDEIRIQTTVGSSFERDSSNRDLYGAAGLNLTAAFGSFKTRHFLALNTVQSSGHRYNTAMNNNKIFYRNQIQLQDENQLSFSGGFISNSFGANGFYAPPGDIESKETVKTGLAAATGKFRLSENWMLRPEMSYRYNNDDYIFVRQNPALYENIHFSHVINSSMNNTISTRYGIIGFGVEFRSELLRSNSLGRRNRENLGFFAEYGHNFTEELIFNAGAYLNYSRFFGWHLFPSADIGYNPGGAWHFYANMGTGSRVPTFTDWYYNGPENIGNSSLIPEKAVYFEAGIKYSTEKLNVSAGGFYQYTRNFIDWVKNNLGDPWQPHNFQNIKTPGITISADYRLIRPTYRQKISFLSGFSYTHLAPEMVNPAGENFNYSHYALENLKDQFVLRFSAIYMEHLKATAALRYERRVNYKDYILLDLKLERSFRQIDISLNINNATDTKYIETGSTPLPGRWVSTGISLKL